MKDVGCLWSEPVTEGTQPPSHLHGQVGPCRVLPRSQDPPDLYPGLPDPTSRGGGDGGGDTRSSRPGRNPRDGPRTQDEEVGTVKRVDDQILSVKGPLGDPGAARPLAPTHTGYVSTPTGDRVRGVF